MNKDIRDQSHVELRTVHANTGAHSCGYCHNNKKGGSRSWGLVSEKTRVDDYEEMINKGWRRCGTYFYKTDLKGSCCQLYTIRQRVQDFQLSYKQRKALLKFNRFLNGELDFKLGSAAAGAKEPAKPKAEVKPATKSIWADWEAQLANVVAKGILVLMTTDGQKLGLAKDLVFADIKKAIITKKQKHAEHGDISTNAALVLYNANKKHVHSPASPGPEAFIPALQQAIVAVITPQCETLKFEVEGVPGGHINFRAKSDLKAILDAEQAKQAAASNPVGQRKPKDPQQHPTDRKDAQKKKKETKQEPLKDCKPESEPVPTSGPMSDIAAKAPVASSTGAEFQPQPEGQPVQAARNAEEDTKTSKPFKPSKPAKAKKPKAPKESKGGCEEEKAVPAADIPKTQYGAYFKELVPNMNPKPAHVYTVEIVPAIATKESFEIFKLYQEHIHNEPGKTMSSYADFLCGSPLYDPRNPADVQRPLPLNDAGRVLTNQGVWPQYLGSYHMYHKIDGKLVAVGVIDLTPSLLSSVYFFYDPKYKFLNLGIVGALREIEYVRKIQEAYCPTFAYYYMGYYIQDCIKSVYKGDYYPSFLLCPETYTWQPLEDARPKIAKSGYARLADPAVPLVEEMKFAEAEIKKLFADTMILTEDDVYSMADLQSKPKLVLREVITRLGKKILPHLTWTN